MAIKVLKGEKIENITAESPRKIYIAINQASAKKLNITFPGDILGSAKVTN
jgi:ABC-type uncharacterized transport system substrate-binding protein